MAEITQEIDFPLNGGEGPFWDAPAQALWFIDMGRPDGGAALLRLDARSRAVTRWPMPATIGSFALTKDGQALVSLRNGVHLFDPGTGALKLVAAPEAHLPGNRLNDGKTSPDGRFFVGSMDDRPQKEKTGALYRIDPDFTCTKVADGLIVSNGLAWSPDGKTLYHSDSRGKFLQAFDYDAASGALSRQRLIRTFQEEDGRPDGAAMDIEGFYWSAGVSAGVLNRIAPDGRIVQKIPLPVLAPSMPCFGGPDMKTLYVTSLNAERGGVSQQGALISLRVDVAGTEPPRFG